MLPLDRLGRGCCVCARNLIEKNSIDHRLSHRAAIPATSEALFDLSALTQRSATGNRLNTLTALAPVRNDAPPVLRPRRRRRSAAARYQAGPA